MMLDVTEAIQRKQRVGMQYRRGPVSSSPLHASFSPGHSQAPHSLAAHQVPANKSSPAQAARQTPPQQIARSPGSTSRVPVSSGPSRMQTLSQTDTLQSEQPANSNGTIVRDGNIAEDKLGEPWCLHRCFSAFQAKDIPLHGCHLPLTRHHA